MSKDRLVYIHTILDCIERIQEYTTDQNLEVFLNDQKTQDAVIRNLEVIGQAVKDYGVDELCQLFPKIPWEKAAGMRNIIAHDYLGVDLVIVWETIERQLSPLSCLRQLVKQK